MHLTSCMHVNSAACCSKKSQFLSISQRCPSFVHPRFVPCLPVATAIGSQALVAWSLQRDLPSPFSMVAEEASIAISSHLISSHSMLSHHVSPRFTTSHVLVSTFHSFLPFTLPPYPSSPPSSPRFSLQDSASLRAPEGRPMLQRITAEMNAAIAACDVIKQPINEGGWG